MAMSKPTVKSKQALIWASSAYKCISKGWLPLWNDDHELGIEEVVELLNYRLAPSAILLVPEMMEIARLKDAPSDLNDVRLVDGSRVVTNHRDGITVIGREKKKGGRWVEHEGGFGFLNYTGIVRASRCMSSRTAAVFLAFLTRKDGGLRKADNRC